MSDYSISKIYPGDRFANSQIQKLLQEEGIRRDPNLTIIAKNNKRWVGT